MRGARGGGQFPRGWARGKTRSLGGSRFTNRRNENNEMAGREAVKKGIMRPYTLRIEIN